MELNTSLQSLSSTIQNTTSPTSSTHSTSTVQSTTPTSPLTTTQTDSYISSNQIEIKGLYTKPKKLTEEQIQTLKEAQTESQMQLVKQMAKALFIGQSSTSKLSSMDSTYQKLMNVLANFSDSFNLPEIVTNVEDAEKAVTDDGAYSVNSVATRIMDMATSLAGEDPEKLELMRNAVIKGFDQAGITFSEVTGESKLPQICLDTYDEIMKRFDILQNKYVSDSITTSSNESK